MREQKFNTFPEYLAKWSSFTFGDLQKRWFHDDPEILNLLDEVVRRENGGDRTQGTLYNVQSDPPSPTGNSKAGTLRRLRKDRPDLLTLVIEKKMSANAAAIEAGFRRKTWSAPADVEALAAAVERRYPGWRLIHQEEEA